VVPISIRFERFTVFHTSTSGGGHDLLHPSGHRFLYFLGQRTARNWVKVDAVNEIEKETSDALFGKPRVELLEKLKPKGKDPSLPKSG
jgi:hypothetical protein